MRKLLLIISALILAPLAIAQTTPNLGLNIPGNNAPNWGASLNSNFSLLDLLLSGKSPLPALSVTGVANFPNLTTWETGTAYTSGNAVWYLGNPYFCISTCASGTLPTNATFWSTTIGITALTGDVTASGSGSATATLASTAVAPGVYTSANITVDQKGRITAASSGPAFAQTANNLSDLANSSTARANLGLGSAATQAASAFDAAGAASAAQAASLQKANNLSDLANAATARTSLGLGTAATSAATAFDAAGSAAAAQAASLQKSNNLSDLASATTARSNLGLGSSSTLAAAAVAQTANNLSDLASNSTARSNLGLGAFSGLRYANGSSADTSATATQGFTLLGVGNASQLENLFSGLTGCGTASYVLVPAAGDCVPQAGGAQIAGALSGTLTVPQLASEYVPTLTTTQKSGTADSQATLQAAINSAIAVGSDLYVPCGTYNVQSPGLTFSSSNFHIRGCGNGSNQVSPVQLTLISASGYGYNTLTVGNGGIWSNPNGWVKDMILNGPSISNSGYAALVVNGAPQTWLENVGVGNDDIGMDFIGNSYGSTIVNPSCAGDNVGINFRNGAASGSDISVWNPWCHGIIAGIEAAGTGGGYHVHNGQVSGGYPTGSPNDNTAAVIVSKEYPSGNLGEGSIDFFGTSFEGTNNAWEIRAYAAARIALYDTSMNATSSSAPAIGVYKNTNQQFGQITSDSNGLSGYFSNPQLIVASGQTVPGAFISERGTSSAGQNPVINGVSTYVTNMAAQSGLPYSVGTDRFGLFSQGMWFGNNSGVPAYSTNGSSWNSFFISPMTNLGDTTYQGSTGPLRLAGNTTTTDEVYVSHGSNSALPTTKTCSAFVNGAGNTVTCTLSTAAAIGEFVVVGLIDYQSGSTHAVTDSHSDTFTAIGSIHNASTIGANTQLYYFGPLTASITTITATSSTGSYLAIEANTATNVVSSSPQDGSVCYADTTAVTAIPCGTTITATQANDYVFCDAHNATVGDSFTAGSGFTLGSSFNSNSTAQYQVQAAVGATTPSITSSSASPATMACAAFKSNASGGGAANSPYLTNTPTLALNLYTVSSGTGHPALPSASYFPAGTQVGVTDCTAYTPGALCTGGGADFMIGVTNGTAWTVH